MEQLKAGISEKGIAIREKQIKRELGIRSSELGKSKSKAFTGIKGIKADVGSNSI